MLSLKDCFDYLDIPEELVTEVAHHEHIPLICALEECNQLLNEVGGVQKIQEILLDNMVEAHESQAIDKERHCMKIYGQFVVKYTFPKT